MEKYGIIYKITNKAEQKSVTTFIGKSNFISPEKFKKAVGDKGYIFWKNSALSNIEYEELCSVISKNYKEVLSKIAISLNTIKPNGYNDPSKSNCSKKECITCKTNRTYKWFNDTEGRVCATCHRRHKREKNPADYERYLRDKTNYRTRNPERVSKQKKDARLKKYEIYKKKCTDRYWSNPEKSREEKRLGRLKNPFPARLSSVMRKKNVKRATPPWAKLLYKKDFINIYKNRPEGYHVDHIIPLKGVNKLGEHFVSGLHVPWNLQYLRAEDNMKKKNKVEVN